MSTDLYKSVKWNDGEGITPTDLNDAHRFLAAKLSDQLLEKLIGSPNNYDPVLSGQKGANSSVNYAYALSVGGAQPLQGSTTSKIKISAGTLYQKVANADGDNATLLAYTFDGTDEFTITAGHATLNRVDMIQMKLERVDADPQTRDFEDATTRAVTSQSMNKKQRVQCTLSLKTGSGSSLAASPAYPTPDAGYVPIACIVVGATWAGAERFYYDDMAGARAVIHDLRMPINVKPQCIAPTMWTYTSGTFTNTGYGSLLCTSATGQYAAARVLSNHGRLVGLTVVQKNGVNAANNMFLGTENDFKLVDLSATIANNTTTSPHRATLRMQDIEAATQRYDSRSGLGGTAPTVTGNGTHGLPIWANGKRGPEPVGDIYGGDETIVTGVTAYLSHWDGGHLLLKTAAVDASSPQQELYGAIFYVAEGI